MPRLRMIHVLTGFLISLTVFSCAPKRPVLIIHPEVLSDGGRQLRDLYRSFWLPPNSDQDMIRVGLIPSSAKVRFRPTAPMKIRAHSESQSWDVASPEGVIWEVQAQGLTRPSVNYSYAVVESHLFHQGQVPDISILKAWRHRGFPDARWVGPPRMDIHVRSGQSERFFVSVSKPSTPKEATRICGQVKKSGANRCDVLSRIDLPPIGKGVLRAVNGNFSQPFEGYLELISPHGPVRILHMSIESLTKEETSEMYGPQLLIVPNIKNELSLIQSTSFGNYLEGVVPAETFPDGPIEALKAQAVVARTYASRYISLQYASFPFLLCASTNCQVYRGVNHKKKKTSDAVRSTDGVVLVDQSGALAETFYHSISGGHTENKSAIFGGRTPSYLQGVSDVLPGQSSFDLRTDQGVRAYLKADPISYCGSSRYALKDRWRWKEELDQGDISALLKRVGLSAPLTSIRVLERGVSGRALRIELASGSKRKFIADQYVIRQKLGGLRSSLFVFDPIVGGAGEIEKLIIYGGASGHGVGMSQVGAIGRAEHGQKYPEILKAYYPTTRLTLLSQIALQYGEKGARR